VPGVAFLLSCRAATHYHPGRDPLLPDGAL
jgi:hypothetical protein